MINLKTDKEIALMKQGGCILSKVVAELKPYIKAGITTKQVDTKAAELIRQHGGDISFNKVKGYHWSTCLPINEQIVHTPPSDRVLKDGDVLTLDIGVYYHGLHTDYADTFVVGKSHDASIARFLQVGKETLAKAIKVARTGEYIGSISQIIEAGVSSNGYFVVRALTGHGIGCDLHEDPFVMGYLDRPINKTYKMQSGLVIAIEVIYALGSGEIAYEPGNSWSIITKDHSISACFEETIALSGQDTYILT